VLKDKILEQDKPEVVGNIALKWIPDSALKVLLSSQTSDKLL
jgi:hypothetical protein